MEVLKINGQEKEFPHGIPATLGELLAQLNISQATVLVQIDGQVVKREGFAGTKLSSSQSLELLRFVGGG